MAVPGALRAGGPVRIVFTQHTLLAVRAFSSRSRNCPFLVQKTHSYTRVITLPRARSDFLTNGKHYRQRSIAETCVLRLPAPPPPPPPG